MPQTAQVTYVGLDCQILEKFIQPSYNSHFSTLQDQIVQRDMCFVIDADKPWSLVTDVVQQLAAVSNIQVFDLYQ
jgi:phenylalanyl-tRNA synthetase beta subunit